MSKNAIAQGVKSTTKVTNNTTTTSQLSLHNGWHVCNKCVWSS